MTNADILNKATKFNERLVWEAMIQAFGKKEAKRLKRSYGLPKLVWREII